MAYQKKTQDSTPEALVEDELDKASGGFGLAINPVAVNIDQSGQTVNPLAVNIDQSGRTINPLAVNIDNSE